MNINGKARIFKKELNGHTLYSTGISNKKQDGTYEHMYVSVNFPKDIDISNNTDIDIKDGFISFYKNKNGFLQIKLVVTKFEYVNEIDRQNDVTYDDSDLPF